QRDGDFPASAKVVSELRRLTSEPNTTAANITEVILKEPSLGTRILHLVNSSFYQRAKPIMTVSQAVIQIGMKPLAELCSGLVLLQKFVPAARRGGPFANCLQKTICTAILASSLSSENDKGEGRPGDEAGYLAGSFLELGTLLLAYYFPQIYQTAVKRAKAKDQSIGTSIQDITGVSPLELSITVVEALNLPEYYREILVAAFSLDKNVDDESAKKLDPRIIAAAKSIQAAEQISNVVVFKSEVDELQDVMKKVQASTGIDVGVLGTIVGELPSKFKEHCSALEVTLTSLPEFTSVSAEKGTQQSDASKEITFDSSDSFSHFVEEIREAIESNEPTSSVITTVMETFAWGLKFDRVLLLLLGAGKHELIGRMLLGPSKIDPRSFHRSVQGNLDPHAPDAVAFRESRPVFFGDPLFDDGWPIAVIPVGFNKHTIGVIYADRIAGQGNDMELTEREKAAIGMLSELLSRSLEMSPAPRSKHL
ncbi:MAG: HDOD domain-containing protein, partial [Bdellovibrionales bacterium]|nr:HDOD domain-containing protein [Bdellovibrionales bacterium]